MRPLARALARESRDHGLPVLADWFRANDFLVDGVLDFPPAPRRGEAYSASDLERLVEVVDELPEILDVATAAEAWEARAAAEAPDALTLLGGMESGQNLLPVHLVGTWREHVLGADLAERWAKQDPEQRTAAWMGAWAAKHVAPFVQDMRRYLAALADLRWFDPRGHSVEDVLRTLTDWAGTGHSLRLERLAERLLQQVHGLNLGRGGVPNMSTITQTRTPLGDLRAADERHRARSAQAERDQRRDLVAAWTAAADLLDELDTQGRRTVASLNSAFRRRLGSRPPYASVSTGRQMGEVRWTVAIHGLLPGVDLFGPPSRVGELEALQNLHLYARAIRDLDRASLQLPAHQWRGLLQARYRAIGAGFTTNPSSTWAPGLAPSLLRAARVSGMAVLAGWLEVHEAELGAQLADLDEWSTSYPNGWQTRVFPARSPQSITRIDQGPLLPMELLQLPTMDEDLGAMGPPGFERWAARGQLRHPNDTGTWTGTMGHRGHLAEWVGMVADLRRTGQLSPLAAIEVLRQHDGRLVLQRGADQVRLAVEAGIPVVQVTIRYQGGSEAMGLVLDPATGVWDPYPPGRVVAVWTRGRQPGDGGSWRRGVVASRFRLTDGTLGMMLEDGTPANLRTLRLANEPLQVRRKATTRNNPVRRVRASIEDGEVALRRPGAHHRLLDRAASVHLVNATLERDRHGDVVAAEGELVEQDHGAPTPLTGWAMVGSGDGGRVLADRATLDADHATVFLTCAPGLEGGQLDTLPLPVRTNAGGEVVIDAEGRKYPAQYQVVEAAVSGDGLLMVSHRPSDLLQWTPGYPPEFQTRDLGAPHEQAKIRAIARGLDPVRLLHPHLDPTLGPPVAWEGEDGRLYALGGNGRTIAILIAPEERYQAYVDAGRKLYGCWPTDSARAGHRWVLLRVVRGLSRLEATQLAAASQLSTAAEEGRIGKALGLVRSLQLDLARLPAIVWTAPISAANVNDFTRDNIAFVKAVLDQMDPAKRQVYFNDSDKLGPLMAAVMLGFLPEPVRRAGLFYDPKTEDALMGALPTMVTLQSRIQSGEIWPVFDLLEQLPAAVNVFTLLRARRLSFRQLAEVLDAERRTTRMPGTTRLSDTAPLALALAGVLYNAARRTAPEDAASAMLAQYLDQAMSYDPRQKSLFGKPRVPEPAPILGGLVPGFLAPAGAEGGAGNSSQPAMFGNPAVVQALRFDRSAFPMGSDCRDWCKKNSRHPGVPRSAPGGFIVEQRQATGRPQYEVTLAPGVTAIMEAAG